MIVVLQYLDAPIHLLEKVIKYQLNAVLPLGFGGLSHFDTEHVRNLKLQGILKQRFRLVEGLKELFEVGAQHQEVERALEFVDTGFKLQGCHFGEVFTTQESEERGYTLGEDLEVRVLDLMQCLKIIICLEESSEVRRDSGSQRGQIGFLVFRIKECHSEL